MRASSERDIDRWWAALFELAPERLWSEVTVGRHAEGRLADYPGWWVAWRDRGVHVSAPVSASSAEIDALATVGVLKLASADFWVAFADRRRLVLRGPSRHAYLDVDPGPAPDVVKLEPSDLDALRALASPAEWEESGWADSPPHAFGLREEGRVVAAANLNKWDGVPRDIGVLVAATHRGRGLSEIVGRHAASYAIREHGLARWAAVTTNVASIRAADRLGFEPRVTQLAVRPPL